MLRIQVTSYANQPPRQPLQADFDEMGGSIGRSDGNVLILPDEKRYVSRTQATVSFRGGAYFLRDHGSATPTVVNSVAVGNGNEIPLRDGDELRIGDYVMSVSANAAAAAPFAADPFADLIPPVQQARPHAPVAPAQPSPVQLIDDPFDAPPAGQASRSREAGVIPQDFDPFADSALQEPAGQLQQNDPLDLIPSSTDTVDDLFGLKGASTWDPLGGSAAASPHADPFDDLAPASHRAHRASPSQRDDVSILSTPFSVPLAKPEPPSPQPDAPRQSAPGNTPAPPVPAGAADMVVSWDSASAPGADGEIKTVVLPSPRRPQPQRAEQKIAQPPPPGRPVPNVAGTPIASSATSTAATGAGPDELLQAFLSGTGLSGGELPGGLTPEFMKLIGELLRESISGTLQLLLARALTKREVRAEATVIVARENNPLKFSPNVEAALTHLLGQQGRGFMLPADALRDAYNDLRSHQFGVMAGMRAALEGVLARFDPSQLEGRLTRKTVLASLVPSSRRARLWELYEQLYREISKEAQDDFQTLFGKEFLRAYEAQIDKLDQEDAVNKR